MASAHSRGRWPRGSTGRIAALPPIPGSDAAALAVEPGVTGVGPLIVVPQAAQAGSTVKTVNLIGTVPHGLGSPTPSSGRPVASNGQAVVDSSLGLAYGRHFSVGGHPFTVVGLASHRTCLVVSAMPTSPSAPPRKSSSGAGA